MDKSLVVIISAAAIGLIFWWFFGKKLVEQTAADDGKLQRAAVIVEGGYKPEVTVLKGGVPAELTFIRKDVSSCLEEVIFPDFGIQRKLSLERDNVIAIPDLKPGEYDYSCGMRMYHGKLVVR